MAVPKHKLAKFKKYLRRQHQKLTLPSFVKCQNCGEKILPHQVCPFCGYYRREKVVEIEKEEKKKKEK